MPIRKHYECVETFNTLKVQTDEEHLLLIIKAEKETDEEIEILLTRHDLLDLVDELNSINEFLYEMEKGGSYE